MKHVPSVVCAAILCVVASTGTARALEFIVNGNFEGPAVNVGLSGALDLAADTLPQGWTRLETFSGAVAENSFFGPFAPNGPSQPGNQAMEFVRNAGDNSSGDWTSIEQALSINASQYTALSLNMDIQVLMENLGAGGFVAPAFEWPVVAEIQYIDQANGTQVWRHGWYISPPGDQGNGSPVNDPGQGLIPFYSDTLVPINTWSANTFNLFAELPQVKTITALRVGGSGWLFQGFVDNVSLQGIPEPASLSLLALGGLALLRRRRK